MAEESMTGALTVRIAATVAVILAKAGNKLLKFFSSLCALLVLSACSITGSQQGAETLTDTREVRALLTRAVSAQNANDLTGADLLFQEMMNYDPESPDALNSYAIFLREQWRLEEAEEIYLRALKYAPNDSMSHWNLAVLYDLYLGQAAKALKHYQAYQRVTEQPDKRVHGWLVDLQHRIKQQAEDNNAMEIADND